MNKTKTKNIFKIKYDRNNNMYPISLKVNINELFKKCYLYKDDQGYNMLYSIFEQIPNFTCECDTCEWIRIRLSTIIGYLFWTRTVDSNKDINFYTKIYDEIYTQCINMWGKK